MDAERCQYSGPIHNQELPQTCSEVRAVLESGARSSVGYDSNTAEHNLTKQMLRLKAKFGSWRAHISALVLQQMLSRLSEYSRTKHESGRCLALVLALETYSAIVPYRRTPALAGLKQGWRRERNREPTFSTQLSELRRSQRYSIAPITALQRRHLSRSTPLSLWVVQAWESPRA